jgi:hypothetical protein
MLAVWNRVSLLKSELFELFAGIPSPEFSESIDSMMCFFLNCFTIADEWVIQTGNVAAITSSLLVFLFESEIPHRHHNQLNLSSLVLTVVSDRSFSTRE